MINLKKILATGLIATTVFTFAGCGVQSDVVAKVSGVNITSEEVDAIMQADIEWLTEQYGENFREDMSEDMKAVWKEARLNATTSLIEDKILSAKASELGIMFSDEEMNKLIDEERIAFAEYFGGEEQLQEQLSSIGYTEDSLREMLKKNIINQRVIEEIIKDVEVPDDEVKKYYDENAEEFTTKPGVSVKHILYPTLDEATAAKNGINSSADFTSKFDSFKDNVYGEGSPIAEDLGFVEYDSTAFVEEFMAGIQNLKEGEISEPIKTEFGYHIVLAEKISSETILATYDEVKESIASYLIYTKESAVYNETMDKWKKEEKVKVYDKNL